jgi:hypothetical protein
MVLRRVGVNRVRGQDLTRWPEPGVGANITECGSMSVARKCEQRRVVRWT